MDNLDKKAQLIAKKKALLALMDDEPWAIRHFLGDTNVSISSSAVKNIKFEVKVMGEEDNDADENNTEE